MHLCDILLNMSTDGNVQFVSNHTRGSDGRCIENSNRATVN